MLRASVLRRFLPAQKAANISNEAVFEVMDSLIKKN